MPRCADCGCVWDETELECPSCARRSDDAGSGHFTDEGWFAPTEQKTPAPIATVARFANAAEAGYFAHELTHAAGIPAATSLEEDLDGLTGFWTVRFSLLVPESRAEQAAAVLRELIDQTDGEDADFGFDVADRGASSPIGAMQQRPDRASPGEEGGLRWMPIVLTLAASSMAFWSARKFDEPNREPAPAGRAHDTLWNQLSVSTAPWVQRLPNGRGVRELLFEPEDKRAIFREDIDGDGVYERQVTIRR